MKKLGIVAGSGSLPLETLEGAKKQGFEVHVCAVKTEASDEVVKRADSHEWVYVGQLSKLINYFQSKKVSQVVFGGKIHKLSLLRGEVRPDFEMIALFASIKDRRDDTLLGTIANYLTKKGIEVIDSTAFLSHSLPGAGLLTSKKLTEDEAENVRFGYEAAKQIAGLDIGQTVVVKDMSIVAVESVEGTDACIFRGGELAGDGVIVVKVEKPNQDMRFDVPAVGPDTLKILKQVKAKVLAIEAKKTIVIDRDEFLKQADKNKIKVMAFDPNEKS